MAQHFLLSRRAKTLTIGQVCAMSDAQVEETFRAIRWADTGGEPVCIRCGHVKCYDARRTNGAARWRCAACKHSFSLTSGTLFASHKMPLRSYLAAIAIFANEVKGKSALALSRDLGTAYKTAFVLAHKLREAMAQEMKGEQVGGEGEHVETDGAYFGGYVKPANQRMNRLDRRLLENQSGKRKVVVIVRERDGDTIPAVFKTEAQALAFIRAKVKPGSIVHADEARHWDALEARYEMRRINHQEEYANGTTHTNNAESFFSRMRRAELGHHHHISGAYLIRYAQEGAWREDNRRVANGEQVRRIAGLALSARPSVDFAGYWQRHKD